MPMKWKIIPAYLKGFWKYRRMGFPFWNNFFHSRDINIFALCKLGKWWCYKFCAIIFHFMGTFNKPCNHTHVTFNTGHDPSFATVYAMESKRDLRWQKNSWYRTSFIPAICLHDIYSEEEVQKLTWYN